MGMDALVYCLRCESRDPFAAIALYPFRSVPPETQIGNRMFPPTQKSYINPFYLDAATIIEEDAENGIGHIQLGLYSTRAITETPQVGVIYPTIMLKCYHFREITLKSKRSGRSLQQ